MPRAATSSSCLDFSPMTVELAVRFVLRESATLAAALRAPGEADRVAEALRWHDEAHRAWLALLATAHWADWTCGPALDRLYSYHGRVAELFDRGCGLSGGLAELLDEHLDRLTGDAVAALRAEAHAGTPSPDPGDAPASRW